MAKYISIPTTATNIPSITFNTDLVTSVVYTAATTFVIWAFGKSFTFTTSANGAKDTVTAINSAILNPAGPQLIQVAMPSGVTIAAVPVVA
jgi:hypothetical protein